MNKDKKQALIIAHYHKSGKLRSDTLSFLKNCEGFFKRVILVSTNLDPNQLVQLPNFVECHTRENVGYDFFSYRLGIEHLRENIDLENSHPDKIHEVTLMNTSFLIFDSKKFIEAYFVNGVQKNSFHFSGLTMHPKASLAHPHLQSFLLSFSEQILRDPKVIDWWSKLTIFDDKSLIIKKYEIGISKHLAMLGYNLNPIYRSNAIKRVLDPTHDNFEEILDLFSILKIGLYTINPSKLNLGIINQRIRESASFKALIIEGIEN